MPLQRPFSHDTTDDEQIKKPIYASYGHPFSELGVIQPLEFWPPVSPQTRSTNVLRLATAQIAGGSGVVLTSRAQGSPRSGELAATGPGILVAWHAIARFVR